MLTLTSYKKHLRVSLPIECLGKYYKPVYNHNSGRLTLKPTKQGKGCKTYLNSNTPDCNYCTGNFARNKFTPDIPDFHRIDVSPVIQSTGVIVIDLPAGERVEAPVQPTRSTMTISDQIKNINEFAEVNGYAIDVKDNRLSLIRVERIG